MSQGSRRKSLSKILDAVVARSSVVQAVLIAAGLLGLLAVPLLERKINFDENALLAGSAKPTIRSKSPDAYALGKRFASSLAPSFFSPSFTQQLQQQIQQQLRLQVSNHTFIGSRRTEHPRRVSSSRWAVTTSNGSARQDQRQCTNVHVVLESRRGDGKEALVLVTPINHQQLSPDFEQDGSGVRLALTLGFAMLHHLQRAAPWLAKDVIWVIPDASCGLVESMQAWTDAYQRPVVMHPSTAAAQHPLTHFNRAGVLQQAVVFELPTGNFNQLQVSLEGYNGLLPKLDMFWLFRYYSWHYVGAPLELPQLGLIQQAIQPAMDKILNVLLPNGGSSSPIGKAVQQHLFKYTTMVQFMLRQAAGLPLGAHAPFKGLMVDAATLRVLQKHSDGTITGPVGFTVVGNKQKAEKSRADLGSNARPQRILGFDEGLMQLGDVLELNLRSCSVLIERFHHSLFLYVLTGLDHYVSVERYIGPLIALITVLVLQAAAIKPRPKPEPPAAAAASGTVSQQQTTAAQSGAGSTSQRQQQQQEKDKDKETTAEPVRQQNRAAQQVTDSTIQQQQQQQQQQKIKDEVTTAEPGEEEQVVLEDPLKVPPPKAAVAAAADRAPWLSAVKLVIAAHILAVALSAALRQAPLLLQLLNPQVFTTWVAAAAAAPEEHMQELGLGLGFVLVLVVTCEGLLSSVVASADAKCSKSTSMKLRRSSGCTSSLHAVNVDDACGIAYLSKVLVVEFSLAAAALAAVACLNWALCYAACLVLVPLAVGCAPASAGQAANGSSDRGILSSGLVLLLCSPPSLVLIMMLLSGSGLQALLQLHWLQSLVLESSLGAYLLFWGLCVPFWCLLAWSLHVQDV